MKGIHNSVNVDPCRSNFRKNSVAQFRARNLNKMNFSGGSELKAAIQNRVWDTKSLGFLDAAANLMSETVHVSQLIDFFIESFPDSPIGEVAARDTLGICQAGLVDSKPDAS